jgi:DNA-binding LytR/AlgR family response regulator
MQPDVVFLDIGLPGLTGYEVAEQPPVLALGLLVAHGLGKTGTASARGKF